MYAFLIFKLKEKVNFIKTPDVLSAIFLSICAIFNAIFDYGKKFICINIKSIFDSKVHLSETHDFQTPNTPSQSN